jgi:hypothetical protein
MEEWTSRGVSGPEHVRNGCRRPKNGTTIWTNLMLRDIGPLLPLVPGVLGVGQ